jgi:hypothetical protein
LQQLSEQGRQRIDELAQRYSVSTDAVMTVLQSLVNGNGTMAQFNHRELGAGGQWMLGGMTMVGDMFDHGLRAKVEGLCSVVATPGPAALRAFPAELPVAVASRRLRGCRFGQLFCPRGSWPCFGAMVACGTRFLERKW